MKPPLPALFYVAGIIGTSFSTSAEAVTPEQRNFFENKIRPVLVKQCYECHSMEAKKIGAGLLLDSPDAMKEGGESGSPIIAGKPEESLLLTALRHENDLEMPPEKPLSPQVIADFVKWINMGAPDPRKPKPLTAVAEAKVAKTYPPGSLWSFEPIQNPEPPEVGQSDWPRSDIDRFVHAKREEKEFSPVKDASPEVLVRRLYFDLTGLAPTYDQVNAFVAAHDSDSQKAAENLVDELLASPHFGERWGRHWLDVARYGESNGNDGLTRNPTFPHAWRYRDYVIDALNRDIPFDQFITEQIAGDLLKTDSPEERDRLKIATGFLAIGSKPAMAMNTNFAMDVVADQIDVIGSGIIGLSVACARCHDHKFDPIPTKDYYALAGIFQSSKTMWGQAARIKLTAPQTPLHVLATHEKVLPPEWVVEFEKEVRAKSNQTPGKLLKGTEYEPGTPLAMGVREGDKIAHGKINLKGESKKLGQVVPRGFLTSYPGNPLKAEPIGDKESGRLQLAKWLTQPDHPQTARVAVNRIWQHLFGRGIVKTANDFGVYGERPTHPELLDYLATRYAKTHKWSTKQMIREIVLSRTYQLSSQADESLLKSDPENQWLARHSRRRLDAESIRDRILQTSGQLNPEPGEGSVIRHLNVMVNNAGNLHKPSNHRSIYLCFLRNSPPPELAVFDLPDGVKVVDQRNESVLPSQTLFLLNSPFIIDQAAHFAGRFAKNKSSELAIRSAWQHAFSRDPKPTELEQARYFIESSEDKEQAWSSLAQALIATSEFRYID